ncbi:MAG: tripartite tricarboxylate transporter substrate binding protein [Herbaspirillum sp.]|jgi:tripartite-type tricarboxylate transporter receptor subunit TctC|nr:tripartite tricarboxylate transporter substrate binding protein [Herbaspirillum sp.]
MFSTARQPSLFLQTSRALTAAAVLIGMLALPARAEDKYPSKPITLVVPAAPGGSNDVFARLLGRQLTTSLGQPVIVEDRPGASAVIASNYVARSAADGYTLLVVSSSFTTNAAIHASAAFDRSRDLTPVATLAKGPLILAVSDSLPVHTGAEFISYAKAHPGQLNYGTSGIGSINHFASEILDDVAHIKMTHVPYKGIAPAVTDLMGGHVQVVIASAPSLLPQIRSGQLRAVGIASLSPSAVAPDIAPLAKNGIPGYEVELWWGVLGPPGLPAPLVAKLNAEINRIVQLPEMREAFLRDGAEPMSMQPAEFAHLVSDEIARWKKVAQSAGIQTD